jgi:hypothetical protein
MEPAMNTSASPKNAGPSVLSLAQLLEQQPPTAPPCVIEPGLLLPQGILFVGGEPKVGKSLLVANLALSLAAGSDRTGFSIPTPRRLLVCQFELPAVRQPAGYYAPHHGNRRRFETCSWIRAPPAICSARPRA